MKHDLSLALKRLANEKGLEEDEVKEILEAAMAAAYRKDFPWERGVEVEINSEDETIRVFALKAVVEDVEIGKEEEQVALPIAKMYDPDAELEKDVLVEVTPDPEQLGRIAAQTAKQVLLQRMKEAEREVIFKEFSDKVNEIVSGQIRKVERNHIVVNLGRADGFLPYNERIPGEHYYQGQRMRALLLDVGQTTKGPQIILSRAHEDFIKRMFEMEIPEIYSGSVEIKAIAREAGRRTKVAVAARQEGVDPVGSCVGQRGARIQVIMAELGEEKIDIIAYDADPATYVANSLKPAQITQVVVDKTDKSALVIVPENQLSLAIGKSGQNVRLAARMTGWHLDVKSPAEAEPILKELEARLEASDHEMEEEGEAIKKMARKSGSSDDIDQITTIGGIGPKLGEKLVNAGFDTIAQIAEADPEALAMIKGLSEKKAADIVQNAKELNA